MFHVKALLALKTELWQSARAREFHGVRALLALKTELWQSNKWFGLGL